MKSMALLVLACSVLTVSCEEGGGTIDFLPEYMELSDEQPPEGAVGVPYSFRIFAEIRNNPSDDSYDYRFTLRDGDIPPGTEFVTDDDHEDRFALITGVPTETGRFTFVVGVTSRDLMAEHDDDPWETDYDSGHQVDATDVEEFTIVVR